MNNTPELLIVGPANSQHTLVLAHGAGAGMDTPFMNAFALGIASKGIRVVRFEFPYMAVRRTSGKIKPPDREPLLRETWRKVVEKLEPKRLVIGGKSMGGRMASLVADELGVVGLVCLGYPFHPTGKPDTLRVEHLRTIMTPTLILQGTRDSFGSKEEVNGYALSSSVRVHWLKDGNHDLKPRKSSGRTEQENWDEGIQEIVSFLTSLHGDGETRLLAISR